MTMTEMTDTDRLKYEIRALQSYLRNIVPQAPLPPDNILLSSNSLAIQSAILGLENQWLKLDRDAKLQRKFANENASDNNTKVDSNRRNDSNNDDNNKLLAMVTKNKKRENEENGGRGSFDDDDDDDDDDEDEYVKMTKEDAVSPNRTTIHKSNNFFQEEKEDMKMMIMVDDWEDANGDDGYNNVQGNNNMDEEQEDTQLSLVRGKKMDQMDDSLEQYYRSLATSTIARIASSKVHVATPLGALALALHTSLLLIHGERLKCTGVPQSENEEGTKKNNNNNNSGFAPPVRELPPGVLVPYSWEGGGEECANSCDHNLGHNLDKEVATVQTIAFRYFLYGTRGGSSCTSATVLLGGAVAPPTTVYLTLRLLSSSSSSSKPTEDEGKDNMVCITFGPKKSSREGAKEQNNEEHQSVMLSRHVNMEGFKTAKKTSSSSTISPTLFYISLSELLFHFHETFQNVLSLSPRSRSKNSVDERGGEGHGRGIHSTIYKVPSVSPPLASNSAKDIDATAVCPTTTTTSPPLLSDSTLNQIPNSISSDVLNPHRRGDFEGDLLPGGPLQPPLRMVDDTSSTNFVPGNLVGPDHPIFDRTFGDEVGNYNNSDEYYYGGGFGLPGLPGGMGMRPRFDPFGPPGGPTEPGRGGRFSGRGIGRRGGGRGGRGPPQPPPPPGGFGYPNPDHLTPPGGDYFS